MKPGRLRDQNLSPALLLSAGLHLVAMTTLELSPGPWRHGVMPAFRVELRSAPGEAPLQVRLPQRAAAAPKSAPRAQPVADPEPRGLPAPVAYAGSSLPLGARYYRSSEVDIPAIPTELAPLVLPELACVSRLHGTAKARVFINEAGTVDLVEIVEVTPLRGVFEDAAIEALRQVRYQAAEIAGQPVKSQKLVEVKFNPDKEGDAPPG
jgi:outer membrane biosynthesis protein TonB